VRAELPVADLLGSGLAGEAEYAIIVDVDLLFEGAH
jgi:hypothetical protein